MQLVPSEGPARPRWGSGPPLSLRVWERKEAPGLGSPSQLAVAVDAGHGTAKSAFPSGRRCRVAHPERERRGAGRPLPASSSEGGLWCVAEAPGPGSSPLARPVGAARRGAGGRRQLPGAGGRRGSATVTAAAGSRAEARAREGRGCRARRGPGLLAHSGAGRCWSRSQAAAAPARQGWPLVSFSPEPTRVRLSVRLSLAHTERPPPAQAPALQLAAPARLPPPGPRAANPASRQALTSRMGPCFSSRTIRAPPLLAIFLRGHLQRFRGDFLPAFTKLVTPLTKNTRGNHKLNI